MIRFGKCLLLLALVVPGITLTAGVQGASPSVSAARIAQGKALGVQAAPIEIDDFTDFECPACRALYMQTLHPLIEDYVSSGKVYLVHHDFPLSIHPYSHKAAYYADAAAAIGKFAPVENALFSHQPEWASKGNIEPFLAAVLGPSDLRRVDELARTAAIHAAVQRDVDLGTHLGVHETPTLYIVYKGKRVPVIGVVSYAILRRYLDALLRQ